MSGSGGDNTASTSTSTELLSEEVRRELDAIFCWNPVRLCPAPPMLPYEKRAPKATSQITSREGGGQFMEAGIRGIQTRRNFATTPDCNFVETLRVLILSYSRQ
jgi:hypothetical protein